MYRTPSDYGINRKVYLSGYFINRDGKKTPVPLIANMLEYGSRKTSSYPKVPFLRKSLNKSAIEKAMLQVQERYLKDE